MNLNQKQFPTYKSLFPVLRTTTTSPSLRRIAELEKATQKLEHKLRQAELIIAAQKKIAEIFQMPLDPKEGMKS